MTHIWLQLRLPPELHAKLKERAKADAASLNATICKMLEERFVAGELVDVVREEMRKSPSPFIPDEIADIYEPLTALKASEEMVMTNEELDDWRWAEAQKMAPGAPIYAFPPMEMIAPGVVFVYRCFVRECVTPDNINEPMPPLDTSPHPT